MALTKRKDDRAVGTEFDCSSKVSKEKKAMFFEDYIANLHSKYGGTDFHRLYNSWSSIMNTIEYKFILHNDPNLHFQNWVNNIKDPVTLGVSPDGKFHEVLDCLMQESMYYIVLLTDSAPTAKQYIYEAKPFLVPYLYARITGAFFIVEKKLQWFVCLKRDVQKNEITVVKSGTNNTPFDRYFLLLREYY